MWPSGKRMHFCANLYAYFQENSNRTLFWVKFFNFVKGAGVLVASEAAGNSYCCIN